MMIHAGHAPAPRAPQHSLILSSGYSFVSGLLHWLVLTLTVSFLGMGTIASSCQPRACLLGISHRHQIRTLFLVFLALSSCGQAAGFAVVQQQSTQSDEEPTTVSVTTAMTPRTDPQSWEALANATAASTISAITIHLSAHFVMGDYTQEIHFGGKRLVIWGNNATLDAQKKGRFFSSSAGPGDDDDGDDDEHGKTSLELHDLVMQNGKAADGVSEC